MVSKKEKEELVWKTRKNLAVLALNPDVSSSQLLELVGQIKFLEGYSV